MQESGEEVQPLEAPGHRDGASPHRQTAVLRMRGLPFEATDEEIRAFFGQYTTEEILICYRQGRPSGEAYVQFGSHEDAHQALANLDRANIGRRYIELFESSEEEMAAKRPRQRRGASHLLRLRGLPFSATAADVEAFFAGIPIARGAAGITFVYNGNGSPTGECFVEFPNEQARAEGLKRDRESMGNRYIEIFAADNWDLANAMRQGRRASGRGYRPRRGGRSGPGNVDDAIEMLQGLSMGHGPIDSGPGAAGRGGSGQWATPGGRDQAYAGMASMDAMRGQPIMQFPSPATGVFVGAPGPYMAGQQQQLMPSTAQQQDAAHQHMAQGMYGMWPMQQQQQQLQAYRPGAGGQPSYVGPGFAAEQLGGATPPMAPYIPAAGVQPGSRPTPGGSGAAGGGGGVAGQGLGGHGGRHPSGGQRAAAGGAMGPAWLMSGGLDEGQVPSALLPTSAGTPQLPSQFSPASHE